MPSTGYPESIPHAVVLSALQSMRIDPTNVLSVLIDLNKVTLTQYATDAEGNKQFTGTNPVTQTVIIPLES